MRWTSEVHWFVLFSVWCCSIWKHLDWKPKEVIRRYFFVNLSRKISKTLAWTVQYWEYFIGDQGLLPWLIHFWKEKTSLWIEFTINPIRLIKIVVKKRKSSCAKPQNILNFKPINAKHFADVHIRTTFVTLHNINTIKAYIYKKQSIFLDVGNGNNRKFPWINIKL